VDVGGSLYGLPGVPAGVLSPNVAGFGPLNGGIGVGLGVPLGVGVGLAVGVTPSVIGGGVV
jgi:hypothetical protein